MTIEFEMLQIDFLYTLWIIAKQAAEGRKSRAATFEAEVACEAVFGSSARESFYCDDFVNFENLTYGWIRCE